MKQIVIEAIRCKGCGRIGLSVDDVRLTDHKCAGSWDVVQKVTHELPEEPRRYYADMSTYSPDGQDFRDTGADTLEEGREAAINAGLDREERRSVQLFEVVRVHDVDMKAIWKRVDAERDAGVAARWEKSERAMYERLRAKYELEAMALIDSVKR